jgi:hypothetical protein
LVKHIISYGKEIDYTEYELVINNILQDKNNADHIIDVKHLSLDKVFRMHKGYRDTFFDHIINDFDIFMKLIKNTVGTTIDNLSFENYHDNTNQHNTNEQFCLGLLQRFSVVKDKAGMLKALEEINNVISFKDVMKYNNSINQSEKISYENLLDAYNTLTVMPYDVSSEYIVSQVLCYFLPQRFLQSRSEKFKDENGNPKSKFYEYMYYLSGELHKIDALKIQTLNNSTHNVVVEPSIECIGDNLSEDFTDSLMQGASA